MRFVVVLFLLLISSPAASSELPVLRSDSLSLRTMAILEDHGLSAAIDSIKKLTKRNRDNHRAYYELARLYSKRNNPFNRQKAMQAYRRAVALDPDNDEYRIAL